MFEATLTEMRFSVHFTPNPSPLTMSDGFPESKPSIEIINRTQRSIEMLPLDAQYRLYLQRVFDGLRQSDGLTQHRCDWITNVARATVNSVISTGDTESYNGDLLPEWADAFRGTYKAPQKYQTK